MASRGRERSGGTKTSTKLLAIEVNGERVTIDTRAMTIRERQTLRAELAKLPVDADQQDWIAGAVWIALRRDTPDLTFGEVCDSLTIGDVSDLEYLDSEADSPEM
jgi:hypothetical protein